jgi:hypothetical protein
MGASPEPAHKAWSEAAHRLPRNTYFITMDQIEIKTSFDLFAGHRHSRALSGQAHGREAGMHAVAPSGEPYVYRV